LDLYSAGSAPDRDGDGFPDASELIDEVDRHRFRRWFVTIAESQYYGLHPHWPKIRRDCTGLICFAYKEALKTHDSAWLKRFKYLTDSALPDIRAFRYPDVPALRTNLFRTAGGIFQAVATARVLMQYNCRFLGKEALETLVEGDLLFFKYFTGDRLEDVYHAMILVKVLPGSAGGFDGVVVYHTGPEGKRSGEMRRVRISTLNRHPDDTWHVKPGNPRFLGFYRFHILDYRGITE
jgi:uncharacterized protein YfaT (DUF1175 family)